MTMNGKLDETQPIASFFAGKSIFVTGATGFMGKVLIEKLLRSCSGVREIFLLMRPKKGVAVDDRLRNMLSLPLFDKVRKENPESFAKLIVVVGDITEEGLGLRPVERRVLIERVSIVYHVAANVRFDEDMRKDIFSNTRSTRDVCILACEMKNLAVLVHVSSTYAHSDKPVVEEIVYPPLTDWRKTIKTVECLDDRALRIFCAKYLGTMPNTYTFSKRLAEDVISDYSKHLPCVIFRPSIVVSTLEEPVAGWLDNFNGPVGLMIGSGKGVLRTMYGDPDVSQDYVPVDVTIKAMLAATWIRGSETITRNPNVYVVNCAGNQIKRMTFKELASMAENINKDIPLAGILWRPHTIIVKNRFIFYILMLFLHLLPSLFVDAILKISGRQPVLVKLHRRIYAAMGQLSYFSHNEWNFVNKNLQDILLQKVPPTERGSFAYDYRALNVTKYFENCLIGAKLYLLKEPLDQQKENRLHYDRLVLIDRLLKFILAIFVAWMLGRAGFYSYLGESYASIMDGSIIDL